MCGSGQVRQVCLYLWVTHQEGEDVGGTSRLVEAGVQEGTQGTHVVEVLEVGVDPGWWVLEAGIGPEVLQRVEEASREVAKYWPI